MRRIRNNMQVTGRIKVAMYATRDFTVANWHKFHTCQISVDDPMQRTTSQMLWRRSWFCQQGTKDISSGRYHVSLVRLTIHHKLELKQREQPSKSTATNANGLQSWDYNSGGVVLNVCEWIATVSLQFTGSVLIRTPRLRGASQCSLYTISHLLSFITMTLS